MSHDEQPDHPSAGLPYAYKTAATPTTSHIDMGALATHRFADGGGYPPSYRTFVEQYGWGRTFGLWLIYPPVRDGFADGRSRAEHLTDRFRAVYRDGQAEGFWDVSARTPGGEFPVWLSTGLNSLAPLGRDLYAALEQLGTSESVTDETSAGSVTPLPAFQI